MTDTTGLKLKKAREKCGLTLRDVAERTGLTAATILRYESGAIKNIKYDTIVSLASIYGIAPEYLIGWEEDPMIKAFRPVSTKRFPLLGEIACGKPIYAEEQHEAYVSASSSINADFCLIARGDSMTGARIYDGDVVFCRSCEIVDNGKIAVVIIGDEATLKRWYYYPEKQKLILSPENPAYEPLVFIGPELQQIHCMGQAVCFTSNL